MSDSEKENSANATESKNLFQKLISYFQYNSKIHKKLNYSLLYNAYIIVRMS